MDGVETQPLKTMLTVVRVLTLRMSGRVIGEHMHVANTVIFITSRRARLYCYSV